MNATEPYRDTILYLDDEQVNLDVFEASFNDIFQVLIAQNSVEAIELLKENQVKVVITDQRMPDMTGIEFIQKIQPVNPNTVFIILSAFPDSDVLLSSINKTKLFRFMMKPWDELYMRQTIETAIEIYNSKVEREKLILDLQIAREKALESERLKSAFLSNLSHEIRTPINGISGFLQLLDNGNMDPEKYHQYKDYIDQSCQRLITIMNDLIKMSKLQTGNIADEVSEFNLKQFLNSLLCRFCPIAQNKDLKMSIKGIEQIDSDMLIKADRTKLYEIFNQLLNNSIKFTHRGEITIGIVIGEQITFFVEDTGIGIEKDKQDLIFQTFRQESESVLTRSYGGNGLGLTIAKGLVNMLDGKIWLESDKGKGAIFFFTIPVEIVE